MQCVSLSDNQTRAAGVYYANHLSISHKYLAELHQGKTTIGLKNTQGATELTVLSASFATYHNSMAQDACAVTVHDELREKSLPR